MRGALRASAAAAASLTSAEMEWDFESVRHAAQAVANAHVVVIADDSGSIRSSPVAPAGKHTTTQWDELVYFLKLVVQVRLAAGVHFHFLTSSHITDVQTWEEVTRLANRDASLVEEALPPSSRRKHAPLREPTSPRQRQECTDASNSPGRMSLVDAMRQTFQQYNPAKTGRRLITIIATDGPVSEVAPVLRARPCIDRSSVTFLSCKDNVNDLAYVNEIDAILDKIDAADGCRVDKPGGRHQSGSAFACCGGRPQREPS